MYVLQLVLLAFRVATVQMCIKYIYIYKRICTRLFHLTVLLKTRQKTTEKTCQALSQGKICSFSGLRRSHEGTFPKKLQTHHQPNILLSRNPLHHSGNPASLRQNTQSHRQPKSWVKPLHAMPEKLLTRGTWGRAKTTAAPFLGLWLLAGPLQLTEIITHTAEGESETPWNTSSPNQSWGSTIQLCISRSEMSAHSECKWTYTDVKGKI